MNSHGVWGQDPDSVRPSVHLARLGATGWNSELVAAGFQWTGIQDMLGPGTVVFLKPNLTWYEHLPGVTTSPQCIAAILGVLMDSGAKVVVGEADGGYHSFRAEDAFRGHGLRDLCRRYGVQLVNLSRETSKTYEHTVLGQPITIELPRMLVEETDFLITAPVPKVHAMTLVSLAFKNQWGCIPGHMRLRNHADFASKVIAINQLVRTRGVVMDGTYFLDKNGPLTGSPVRMDLALTSNDCGAASLVCCEIMMLDPHKAAHHQAAFREGLFPKSIADIDLNTDHLMYRHHKFTLKRTPINWLALGAFRSRLATKIVYDSNLGKVLHWFLYRIRRVVRLRRLLYGPWEPPTSGKHHA